MLETGPAHLCSPGLNAPGSFDPCLQACVMYVLCIYIYIHVYIYICIYIYIYIYRERERERVTQSHCTRKFVEQGALQCPQDAKGLVRLVTAPCEHRFRTSYAHRLLGISRCLACLSHPKTLADVMCVNCRRHFQNVPGSHRPCEPANHRKI